MWSHFPKVAASVCDFIIIITQQMALNAAADTENGVRNFKILLYFALLNRGGGGNYGHFCIKRIISPINKMFSSNT